MWFIFMLISNLGGITHLFLSNMWKLRHREFSPLVTGGGGSLGGSHSELLGTFFVLTLSCAFHCTQWTHVGVSPMGWYAQCWISIINMVHICLVYGCVCSVPSAFSGDPVANRGKKKIGNGRSFYDSFLNVTAKCIQPGSWCTESLVITAGRHYLWITLR